jgi:hypothetical protein
MAVKQHRLLCIAEAGKIANKYVICVQQLPEPHPTPRYWGPLEEKVGSAEFATYTLTS